MLDRFAPTWKLSKYQSRIAPLEKESNQLTRQFWVAREKVVAEKFDLSASRYRQVEREKVSCEKPAVTLERKRQLEKSAKSGGAALRRSALHAMLAGRSQPR